MLIHSVSIIQSTISLDTRRVAMKYIHMADLHLGKREYDIEERFNDFFRAFQSAVDFAINHEIDIILISGDFFDHADIKPFPYIETIKVLALAREKSIQVVVIEGNHDVEFHSDFPTSWLEVLSREGYIVLLRSEYQEDTFKLSPWDGLRRTGSYIDINGLRIIGINYSDLQAPVGEKIVQLAKAIDQLPKAPKPEFSVMMLHGRFSESGLDDEGMPIENCLTPKNAQPLRMCIDYMALGHAHRKMIIDEWAYNPGSIEICRTSEYNESHGWFLIEVREDGEKNIKYHDYNSRPFLAIPVCVDGLDTYEEFMVAFKDKVERDYSWWRNNNPITGLPIVEIQLYGKPAFSQACLDFPKIKDIVITITDAIGVLIRTRQLTQPKDTKSTFSSDSLSTIEIEEFMKIIQQNPNYSAYTSELVELITQLKILVGDESSSEALTKFFYTKSSAILGELLQGGSNDN